MNDSLGIKFWILPIIGLVFGVIIGPMYQAYKYNPNLTNEILISIKSNPQSIVNIALVLAIVYGIAVPIIISKRCQL